MSRFSATGLARNLFRSARVTPPRKTNGLSRTAPVLEDIVLQGSTMSAALAALVEPHQALAAALGDVAMLSARPAPVAAPAETPVAKPAPIADLIGGNSTAKPPAQSEPQSESSKPAAETTSTPVAALGSLFDTEDFLRLTGDYGPSALVRPVMPKPDALPAAGGGFAAVQPQAEPAKDNGPLASPRPGESGLSIANSPAAAPTNGSRSVPITSRPVLPQLNSGSFKLPETFVTPPNNPVVLEPPAPTRPGPVAQATTDSPIFAVGTDAGVPGKVRVYNAADQSFKFQITPFGNSFTGGVRVAVADIDGDGKADVIAAQGAGGVNRVRAFNGLDGTPLTGNIGNFLAFGGGQASGVFVAAGDINLDGKSEIFVGSDGNGLSRMRVFNGATGAIMWDKIIPATTISGGVRIAAGDTTGDGRSDAILSAGNGSSRIVVLDGINGMEVQNYFAFDPTWTGGINVAVGDVTADGFADIVAGMSTNGSSVKVFSGRDTSSVWSHDGFPNMSNLGVRVGVVDADSDGKLDLLIGRAPGSGSGQVRIIASGGMANQLAALLPYGANFTSGTFVAGDSRPVDTIGALVVLPTVTITAATANAVENGGTNLSFTVSRDITTDPLTAYISISGTASPSTDHNQGAVMAANFIAGQATVTLNVTPTNDSIFEQMGESVVMTVGTNAAYTVGSPSAAIGWITDDDLGLSTAPDGRGGLATQADGLAGAGAAVSPDGVNYSSGTVSVNSTDLSSVGFGQAWGIDRGWTNSFGYDAETSDGNGMVSREIAYLRTDNTDVAVIGASGRPLYFDGFTSVYTARDYSKDTLTQNVGTKEFTLVTSGGSKLVFNNFDASLATYQKGQLKSVTDANGNVTSITSRTTDGKVSELQRTVTVGSTTTVESYLYTYLASGTNAGRTDTITLRRQVNSGSWTTVRTAEYTYHDGTTGNGTAGDLKTAIVKDSSGNVLDTKYYRYYTSSSSTGYAGGLKYAFNADAYERLKNSYATPDSATDSQVESYASDYFEYDSVRRVSKHTQSGTGCSACAGGLGVVTYSISTSAFADGYNSWRTKTVETRADGNTQTVYTNFIGQPILEVYKDTTTNLEWATYHQFDTSGREVLTAMPSAVSGYDETKSDLLNNQSGNYQYLRDSQGLIATAAYATSTTATSSTAGNVNGYLNTTSLKRGESGTAVLQSTIQYYSRTDGSITVYPVANQTRYRNTGGSGGETTSYAYTWYSGTIQPEQVTTTLPTVTTAQNGPNSADTNTYVTDARGRVIWTKDGAGFLTYTEYDEATGAVTKTIGDVDVTQTSTFTSMPSGWTTPSGGGLHQTTTFEVDSRGRISKETDPNGNITYMVYLDSAHEVRVYPGWDTGASAPTGPTQVYREDRTRGYSESLTMSATPTTSGGRPTGAESIGSVLTLNRTVLNSAGQPVYQDRYFNLTGVTYSQSSVTLGTANTNYYRTESAFDKRGRTSKTVNPSGTINRTEFDGQGRAVSQWVGTDDTPTSGYWSPTNTAGTDMVKLSENEYDLGGVGDSNVTRQTQFPGGGATDRKTEMSYDWRNRQVATKSGVEASESTSLNRPIRYIEYDNLSQAIVSEQYDGDGLSITTDATSDGVPDRPSSGSLRAKSTSDFDEQGRVYIAKTFSVDPSSGSVSTNSLASNTWFDRRGLTIKTSSPGGIVSKSSYNGLSWVKASYVSDGGGDSAYADASSLTSDNVLSQSEPTYDIGGRTLMLTSKERFHDETTTGALGNVSTAPKARVSYSTNYFDKANRTTASVNVGTNAGSAYTRPSTVPSRSDTVLVTDYGYNSSGWLETTTDPRALVGKTYYDNLGRTIKSIDNYVDGTVGDDNDKTVDYTFDPSGQMATLKAQLTGGGYQETKWVYGITSPIVSNDVLKEMRYPDTSTGAASSSEKDAFTYNQLGQVLTKTDRNGSVHTYAYDVLGRLTADAITTLGSGVDGTVRRVDFGYDGQGILYLITAYDASSAGNVVNQVQREFSGLAQLTKEFQSVSGAVNTGTTPNVQYAYSFAPSGSTNHSRLTTLTYPNGRALTYNYATGLGENISRLTSITDGGTTLESYEYLGTSIVVKRGHAQSGVDLTYIKQTGESDGAAGDKYTGHDFAGRVIDQRWTTSTPTAKDRFYYGYDRDSNRLYKENALSSTDSELYGYDNLNQITSMQRGTLNGTKTSLTGAATRSQSWDFDALGNFDSQTTNGTAQTRSHNKQNEITSIASATTPTYDSNGSLTKDESGKTFKFDAWNRLSEVKNAGGTTLSTYQWDGLGRRTRETRSGTTTDLYYSAAWQVLEERVSGTTRISYSWSPVYVDAMIARDRDADSNGSLEERLYVAQDANFNVTGLIDTSGTVQERFQYDAFGSFTVLTGAWASRASSSYAWKYLHQGGRWDTDGGVYGFRFREYSPTLGRWLQSDPIQFDSGDTNFTRYESNRPLCTVDPTGLDSTITYRPPVAARACARRGLHGLLVAELIVAGDLIIDGALEIAECVKAAEASKALDQAARIADAARRLKPIEEPRRVPEPKRIPDPKVPKKDEPEQPSCKKVYPNMLECSKLREENYLDNTWEEALQRFRVAGWHNPSNGRTYDTDEGVAAGYGGSHTVIFAKENAKRDTERIRAGSIQQCGCCENTNAGPDPFRHLFRANIYSLPMR